MKLAALLLLLLSLSSSFISSAALSLDRNLVLVSAAALIAVGLNVWIGTPDIYEPAPGSLKGQTIVVTSATNSLGLESVKRLAAGGATVIFTAEKRRLGEQTMVKVKDYLAERGIDNPNISYKILDFEHMHTVRDIPEKWDDVDKVDVLLNNVGTEAILERQYTVDGLERHIQANHLGHFLMTGILARKFSKNARIINVSSSGHDLAGKRIYYGNELWTPTPDDYDPLKYYGQSKLANIMFTTELQRRIDAAGRNWTAVCLHPGASTHLPKYLFGEEAFKLFREAEYGFVEGIIAKLADAFPDTFRTGIKEGATTQVWLAARGDEKVGMDVRGQYIVARRPAPLPELAKNQRAAERLWRESEERARYQFSP